MELIDIPLSEEAKNILGERNLWLSYPEDEDIQLEILYALIEERYQQKGGIPEWVSPDTRKLLYPEVKGIPAVEERHGLIRYGLIKQYVNLYASDYNLRTHEAIVSLSEKFGLERAYSSKQLTTMERRALPQISGNSFIERYWPENMRVGERTFSKQRQVAIHNPSGDNVGAVMPYMTIDRQLALYIPGYYQKEPTTAGAPLYYLQPGLLPIKHFLLREPDLDSVYTSFML